MPRSIFDTVGAAEDKRFARLKVGYWVVSALVMLTMVAQWLGGDAPLYAVGIAAGALALVGVFGRTIAKSIDDVGGTPQEMLQQLKAPLQQEVPEVGTEAYKKHSQSKALGEAVGAVLAVAFAGLFVWHALDVRSRWQSGVDAQGNIAVTGEYKRKRLLVKEYKVQLTFQDQSGKLQTGRVEFYRVGSSEEAPLWLRYDRTKPSQVVTSWEYNTLYQVWSLAGVMLLSAVGATTSALQSWRKRNDGQKKQQPAVRADTPPPTAEPEQMPEQLPAEAPPPLPPQHEPTAQASAEPSGTSAESDDTSGEEEKHNAHGFDELIAAKRYQHALQHVESQLSLAPQDAKLWVQHSQALWFLKRYADSVASGNKAIEIDPTNAEGWKARGKSAGYMKDFLLAAESYQKASELDRSDQQAAAFATISWIKIARYREAAEISKAALARFEDSADAWHDVGYALLLLGDEQAGLHYLSRANELAPNTKRTQDLLALDRADTLQQELEKRRQVHRRTAEASAG